MSTEQLAFDFRINCRCDHKPLLPSTSSCGKTLRLATTLRGSRCRSPHFFLLFKHWCPQLTKQQLFTRSPCPFHPLWLKSPLSSDSTRYFYKRPLSSSHLFNSKEHLRKSLKTILTYAQQDSELSDSFNSFPEQVNLHTCQSFFCCLKKKLLYCCFSQSMKKRSQSIRKA